RDRDVHGDPVHPGREALRRIEPRIRAPELDPDLLDEIATLLRVAAVGAGDPVEDAAVLLHPRPERFRLHPRGHRSRRDSPPPGDPFAPSINIHDSREMISARAAPSGEPNRARFARLPESTEERIMKRVTLIAFLCTGVGCAANLDEPAPDELT